ncbi:hypothetical protein WJX72_004742 [[Myrmecia] bisecta]|uniref:Uncharacterized protein n=1 Tax=[Myrmecia] bisecta TaxID=41462 RepID=A0AAW1PGA0_9CHLO
MSASAAAAFHRWRYARLKTSFGRQLQQILSETQQLLLARLTAHDLEVAQASHQAADKQAAEAQHHDAILRMEAIVRATGERAAAAEADLAAKSEACAALQLLMAELAGLTVAEAAALQERAAGAEQLKQQLVQMHATVSGLEATRQQMQQAADRLSVELAAERECSRALRAGQALRDAIVQALDDPPGQDAARIIERLGTELDVKVEEVAQLAAKLAAMETLGRQLERQSGTETRVKELQDQVCALQLQLASAPPTHISEVTGRLREAEAEVQRLHITSAALRKVLEERPAGAASAEGRAASLSPQKARIAAFGHNKPPAPGGAANAAMLDALADAERRCKEAASGRAEAVQQLQGERDLWRAARDVFVDRVLDLHAYAGSKVLLQTAFAGWRLHLSEAKLAGLEAALQTSQGQAQRAITSIAKRSAALHTYLEGQLQFWEGQALSEVLLHWRLQMAQQASQRHSLLLCMERGGKARRTTGGVAARH